MMASRKWLIVGALGVVCVLALVGLVLSLSGPHQPPPGPPSLNVSVRLVPQVITAAYKAYATSDQLFATTTITNTGKDPIKNFHISYKVPGYVATAGQEDYPVILPGQTVVDWCYPTFSAAKMKAIDSPVQAELDVNYTYDGSNGEKGTSKLFELLSHNDWVWSNLPESEQLDFFDAHSNAYMLAAFVTKDDPEVNSVAKSIVLGISTDSDDGAVTAARRIFNALYYRGLNYVSEPASFWKSGSQIVQFPLETLKNKGGNCVDLSLVFSSLLEAVGVHTELLLSTGHCQFAIVLPESGTVVPIEATVVGDPNVTFEQAVDSALTWKNQELAKGTYYPIDVETMWASGTVPAW
jgi:transglutaminase-like putative cysteine protease